MAYNENLARRIRKTLGDPPCLQEKKMFGGVGFLLFGNMACGVHGDDLIVRVGPDGYVEALRRPHTKVFDMTGRPMSGWLVVETEGYQSDGDLNRWVQREVAYARSLPTK